MADTRLMGCQKHRPVVRADCGLSIESPVTRHYVKPNRARDVIELQARRAGTVARVTLRRSRMLIWPCCYARRWRSPLLRPSQSQPVPPMADLALFDQENPRHTPFLA